MASGMKLWIGIVLGGLLLLAIWGLPPRAQDDWLLGSSGNRNPRLPERMAAMEAHNEILRENWLFQRIQWRDSLLALARASEKGGRNWSMGVPKEVPDSLRGALEEAVRAELSREGALNPGVHVGTVLMDGRIGTHPGVPNPAYMSYYYREVLVAGEPGRPVCFLVDPVRLEPTRLEADLARMLWTPADSSFLPTPLGPCALYARYGPPGPEIRAWLERGAYAFALGGRGFRDSGDVSSSFPPAWRSAFGARGGWGFSADGAACLAGKVDGCRRAVLLDRLERSGESRPEWRGTRDLPGGGRVTRIQELRFDSPFAGRSFGLLQDLEEEFGQDRFQRFWSSEETVDGAFETSFRVPLSEWLVSWALGGGEGKTGTPVVPLNASLLSLLVMGGFGGLAVWFGRRRDGPPG